MRYSPSTNNFYPEQLRYPKLPIDLITVSDEDFRAAMARPAGAKFAFSAAGQLTVTQSARFVPDAQQLAALQRAAMAQQLLDRSDITVLRCYEAGVVLPEAWVSYRRQLRAVVSGTQDVLPGQPPYPPET